MKSLPHPFFDASAVLLSALCLAHCLALPLLAAALPLFGVWAQAEWVHGLFVAIALPLAGLALWRAQRQGPLPWPLWTMAGLGLCGLLAGATPPNTARYRSVAYPPAVAFQAVPVLPATV
jgi:hypothetical protein